MIESLAVGSLAASPSASLDLQPYFVLVIIAAVLVSTFMRAASRKKRANQSAFYNQLPAKPRPASRPDGAQAGTTGKPAPYVGTLLNGIPLHSYDSSHGHQTTGFANERMRAEAELKRRLDALDTARRSGQVSAEQYAAHREAIFKNF